MQFIRSFRQKPLMWASISLLLIIVWVLLIWEPEVRNGGPSDRHIRMLGMFLQLIGALTVWYDLTHTAMGFGIRPSLGKLVEYIVSIFIAPAPRTANMSVQLEGANSTSTSSISVALDPSKPLEHRVAQLEQLSKRIESRVGTVQQEMLQKTGELRTDLKRRTAELRHEIRQAKGEVEHALVGNFYVLSFGIVWLIVGIVIASLPIELLDVSVALGWYRRF